MSDAPIESVPPQDSVLEAFDAVCAQLSGFNEDVSAEWVDGYFAALIASARTIPPSEWLPAMLGDAFERAFADEASVQQAMQALMGRWNQIARELDPRALIDEPDRLRLQPVLLEWDDAARADLVGQGVMSMEQAAEELVTGAVWATGFLDAVDAFQSDWGGGAIAEDDRHWLVVGLELVRALTLDSASLAQFLAKAYPDQVLTRDELIDEACFAVQDLRVFWLEHAPRPATRRVDQAPGRNDLCPCGSGKKFKKCHGLA